MSKFVSSLILSFAIVAMTAFVAVGQEVTKSLSLSRDTTVGAQKISRGDYTVKFIDDKDGQIAFLKGSREVAKANYRLVKLTRPAPDTSVIFNVGTDGSYKLTRIELKGESFALELE